MAEKFQNRYRISSTRIQNWDYGWEAAYYVTIITKGRKCLFGEIVNSEMLLSDIGSVANSLWFDIINHETNIELGDFVVMPNHLHGIIIINGDMNATDYIGRFQSSYNITTPESTGEKRFQNPGKGSLSTIIGSYKSAVTRQCHRLGYDFAWLPRFYERIIKDEVAFQNISNYIKNNPQNWQDDKMNTW
ncbi:MAG: transposase [Saprospiraceae bacterium]